MPTTFLNPEGIAKPVGYTHVANVSGTLVFIAGQVALDPHGNLVGFGDFRKQTEQVYKNLETALKAAGAEFKDVAKMNIYVLDTAELPALREIRDRYVNTANPPVSTLVGVVRLARAEFLVEIEAVAVLP
ncbi:MAG TPA: RidA family protein [Bryobacteraceae bacterium]|nr:RidA family protein [Bryobacteraceae bacterium]